MIVCEILAILSLSRPQCVKWILGIFIITAVAIVVDVVVSIYLPIIHIIVISMLKFCCVLFITRYNVKFECIWKFEILHTACHYPLDITVVVSFIPKPIFLHKYQVIIVFFSILPKRCTISLL